MIFFKLRYCLGYFYFFLAYSVYAQYDGCQFSKEIGIALNWVDNKSWQQDKTKSKKDVLLILSKYEKDTEGIPDTCRAYLLHRMGLIVENNDHKQKIALYRKAYKFYTKQKPTYDGFSIRLLNNMLGRFMELGGVYSRDSFSVYIRKSMDAELERKRQGLSYSDQYPRTNHWFGRYLKGLGNHNEALIYYNEAIKSYPIYQNSKNLNINVARVLNDISILFSRDLQNPRDGIKAANEGLKLIRDAKETRTFKDLNFDLALAYQHLGNSLGVDSIEARSLYYNIALEKYRDMIKDSSNDLYFKKALNNISAISNKLGSYKYAINIIENVIQSNKKDGYLDYLAINYDNLGDSYQGLKNYDSALDAYSQAIDYAFLEFTPSGLFELPDLHIHRALDDLGALETLKSKAEVLYILSGNSSEAESEKYLQSALAHYAFIDQLLDQIRQEFLDESAQFMLAAEVKDAYESAIEVCLSAAQTFEKEDQNYKELAWYYAERSKSIALLEWVNMRKAASIFLKKDEADELFAIIYKRNSTQEELDIATIDQDTVSINTSRSELARYNTMLLEYQNALKDKYPNYQNFLERSYEPPSIQSLYKGILAKDVTVVEYFLGKDNSYAFIISPNQIQVKSLGKYDFFEQIDNFRTALRTHGDEGAEKALEDYVASATSLYDQLIRPLGNISEEVMIIPDEYLLYLPFELLLANIPSDINDFKTYPYWIKEKIIGYNYSVMLFQEMIAEKEKRQATASWGSFAPEFPPSNFPNNPDGSLLYSAQSAIKTAHKLEGKVFYKDTANIANFNQHAGKYKYLQLATHSLINEQDSNIVQFKLWDGSISMQDLYTKHLNAEMVILNVCRTSFGKLYKGAGIASLNRGFVSAGVGSIVSTLWKVDDNYTAPFMEYFVEGIDDTKIPPNMALRNAKLKLMEDSRYHDPFLWGSYIMYGDVYRDNNRPWFWWTIIPLLIIGFILGKSLMNRRN